MAKPIVQVTPPPSPGGPGRLGEKVEATVERVLAWLVNAAGTSVASIFRAGVELFMETVAEILAPYAQHMHDEIMSNPATPDYIRQTLRRPSAGTDSGDAVTSIIYIITGILGGILGINRPAQRLTEYMVDRSLTSARPAPNVAWPMAWRTGDAAEMRDHLRDLGWHDSLISAWNATLRPRPAAWDLLRAAHRGEITMSEARSELARQGWTDNNTDLLVALSLLIPGPADLVAMSVRGAFNPDEIETFQLGLEFPSEFADWMQKQGYTTEWSRKFWYAHWNLPSLTAGYEMFHRGIITSEQLDLLFRTQDVSPFWRDKLRELSYNPLTRVDVRRMYGLGVLDRAGVVRSYLDLGYSPENAERMTEFTIRYETDEDRAATKADVLGGFREGMLSEAEAVDWLELIGYGTDLASYLVAREAAKLARDLLDKRIAIVRDHYVAREITEAQARTQLTALGLASTEIDLKVEDWSIDRRAKTKRPTQAQVSRFLRDEIISVEEFRQSLSDLGYQDRYVDWYLESVLTLKQEDTAKLESDARDEQEAIRVRRIKSDYQVAKAELDVHIAELRTAITDLQLAISARTTRYRSDRRIAEERVTQAELLDQAEADIADLDAQIDAQREAIAYLSEQVNQRQTLIADMQLQADQQRAEIEPDLETAQDVLAELQRALQDTQAEIELKQTQIAQSRAEIAAETADVEQLRRDVAEIQAQIAERNTLIDALQTEIAEIRAQIAERTEEIADYLLTAPAEEDAAAAQDTLAREKLDAETQIRELQVEIERHQDVVAEAREAIAAAQERIRLMEAESAETVQAQREVIASVQVEIEELQDTAATQRREIDESRTAITDLQRPLARTNTVISESRAVIERAEDDVSAATTAIVQLQTQISARREQLRRELDAVTRIRTLDQVVAEYERDVAQMSEQLRVLKLELSSAREDKARLQREYQSDLAVEV